jgi:hypothetical protein
MELLTFEADCKDYCEREADVVYLHLGPARRLARMLGGRAASFDRCRPVALAGLDPVAAAVRRSPGSTPSHRLGQRVGPASSEWRPSGSGGRVTEKASA